MPCYLNATRQRCMKDNDREWKARHLLAPLPPTSLDLKKN